MRRLISAKRNKEENINQLQGFGSRFSWKRLLKAVEFG